MFKYLSKIFMVILVTLLIASFAFFGIGDVIGGGSDSKIAKVGDDVVTAQEVDQVMRLELMRMQQQFGGALTPEIIEQLGIRQQVAQQLVQRSLLMQGIEGMGVTVPDDMVYRKIRSSGVFHNEGGKFDPERFQIFVRNSGKTEAEWVEEVRHELALEQLMNVMGKAPLIPHAYSVAQAKHEKEQRDVVLATIPKSAVQKAPEPNDSQLISFYEERKADYAAPEYRSFSYVTLDESAIEEEAPSDADLRIMYDEKIERFQVDEQKELQQLFLKDKAKVEEIYQAIKQGGDFVNLAKAAGMDDASLAFGAATREALLGLGLLGEKVVDEIFSLADGGVTNVIETPLGFHLFHVMGTSPARTIPFEEAKETLIADLGQEKQADQLYVIAKAMDDAIAEGQSLEEAATEWGLNIENVDMIDSRGNGRAGKAIELGEAQILLGQAFTLEEGEISQWLDGENASYLVGVSSITPRREKALDEVRGQLVTAWKEHYISERLREIALDAAAEFKENATLDMYETAIYTRVPREGKKGLSASVVDAAFGLSSVNDVTRPIKKEDGDFVVAKLTQIREADVSDEDIARVRKSLAASHEESVMAELLRYFQTQFPIKYYN